MIHLTKFDTDLAGRKFKDTSGVDSKVYVTAGYGDNQGNPYLVGLNDDNGKVVLRTVLLKNVEFVP